MREVLNSPDPKILMEQLRRLEEHRAQRLGVNIWLACAAFIYLFSQLSNEFNKLSPTEIETLKILISHLLVFSVLVFDFFSTIYLKPINLYQNKLRAKPYMAGIRDSFLCKTYLFFFASLIALSLSSVRLSIIVCLMHFGFIFVNSTINGLKKLIFPLEASLPIPLFINSIGLAGKTKKYAIYEGTGQVVSMLLFGFMLQEAFFLKDLATSILMQKVFITSGLAVAMYWVGYMICDRLSQMRFIQKFDEIQTGFFLGEYSNTEVAIQLEGLYLGESLKSYMDIKWSNIKSKVDNLIAESPNQTESITEHQAKSIKRIGGDIMIMKALISAIEPSKYKVPSAAEKFRRAEIIRYNEESDKIQNQISGHFPGIDGIQAMVDGFIDPISYLDELQKEDLAALEKDMKNRA